MGTSVTVTSRDGANIQHGVVNRNQGLFLDALRVTCHPKYLMRDSMTGIHRPRRPKSSSTPKPETDPPPGSASLGSAHVPY
jgi:hypothetical protein